MYRFKDFLLIEEKKNPSKNKKVTKNKKQKVDACAPPKSKEATHGGMSFYSPGEL